MQKLELSQQSLNPFANNSSSRKARPNKENDTKYLNAIQPYIHRQRKNSKRQIHPKHNIPLQQSRSKSKKHDFSIRPHMEASGNSKQLSDIYTQLLTLKQQYHTLKVAYNSLAKDKQKPHKKRHDNSKPITKIQHTSMIQDSQVNRLKSQLDHQIIQGQKNAKLLNSFKRQADTLETTKKQLLKNVQTYKAKNKKLEQTVQEKDLMIAYLRSQLSNVHLNVNSSVNSSSIEQSVAHQNFFFQNTAPIFNPQTGEFGQHHPSSNYSLRQVSLNHSQINQSHINMSKISQNQSVVIPTPMPQICQIPGVESKIKISQHVNNYGRKDRPSFVPEKRKFDLQEDSLSFSRDKSKQFQSVNSLLSNCQNDHTILAFTKKDVIILQDESDGKHTNKSSGNRILSKIQVSQLRRDEVQQLHSSASDVNIEGEEDCMTFDHRGMLEDFNRYQSDPPPKRTKTKRLQINTQQLYSLKNSGKDGDSVDGKKRLSKQKKKPLKKKKEK